VRPDGGTSLVQAAGAAALTAGQAAATLLPTQYVLEANYPNPFNPSTQIRFGLPEAAAVTLDVYDVTGRRVAVLLQETPMAAGWHEVSFAATDLASGLYLYRLWTKGFTQTRRMVLLR
jgi:hypothetical protein